MAKIEMKYIHPVKAKGKTYYYYRRDGKSYGRLPGMPGSLKFAARYDEINASFGDFSGEIIAGTVRALVASYLETPEYLQLSEASRRNYRYYCDLICSVIGTGPAAGVKRPQVIEIRNELQITPGKANALIRIMSVVFEHGIDVGLVTTNPAKGVSRLKLRPHNPWPVDVLEEFIRNAPPEIMWAIMVGLYTGQRLGDCLKMQWSDYDGASIRVVQEKGFSQYGAAREIWIPCHKDLRAVLDTIPKRSTRILTTEYGHPWTAGNFRDALDREKARQGITAKLVFHGLRKNAAQALAEAGCSTEQIKAVTGHQTDEMAAFYAKGASQKKLAQDAVLKWEGNEK